MTTRRITFEKQQRERAKKEKAALKRERRQERKLDKGQSEMDPDGFAVPEDGDTPPGER